MKSHASRVTGWRKLAGQVVVRPMLTLTATFDHRYVDGAHAARFAQALLEYCAHLDRFEPDAVVVAHTEHRTPIA